MVRRDPNRATCVLVIDLVSSLPGGPWLSILPFVFSLLIGASLAALACPIAGRVTGTSNGARSRVDPRA